MNSSNPAGTDDPELYALEQTVLQIKKTFENEMPAAEIAQRIRSRLETESHHGHQQAPVEIFSRNPAGTAY